MMEPLLIGEGSRHRGVLTDLVLDLVQEVCRVPAESAGQPAGFPCRSCARNELLLQQPHRRTRHSPVDIERALKNDYSHDAGKRDLQLEAKAHITVQKWIDAAV